MASNNRISGIDVKGDIAWGTHFCLFYLTRDDLIDILVPYFKAGLENNEYCIWVTAEPVDKTDAEQSIRKAVPDFDRYLEKGQIEIIPHTEWYLRSGAFDLQRVLNSWIDKLNLALAKGYDGMRVTSNTTWLEKKDWESFTDYEEQVNNVIGKYRMVAVCTYSLDKCGASELTDVVSNHQFTCIRREGKWTIIENSGRKRIEEKLHESEEELRLMFESVADSITVSDLNGVITNANERTVEMLRLGSKEKLLGKALFEFIPQRYHSEVRTIMQQGLIEGAISGMGNIITRPDGTEFPGEISVSILKNAAGDPTGFITIIRDITERKQAEEIMQLSRFTLDKVTDAVAWVNPDGRYINVNDATCQRFGRSREELLLMYVYDLNPDFSKGKWQAIWEELKQAGSLTFESRHRTKTGENIPVEISANYMEFNGLEYNCAIARDITERKRTEEALQESEKKYRELADLLPQTVFESDERGNFTFANRHGFQSFGYTLGDFNRGLNVLQMIVPEDRDRAKENIRRILRGEKLRGHEYTAQRKDGGTFLVIIYSAPIVHDNKPVGLRGIVVDISERKQIEAQLQADHKELRSLASQLSLAGERERRRIAIEIHDRISQNLAVCRMKIAALVEAAPSTRFAEQLSELHTLAHQIIKETRSLTFELSSPVLYEFGLQAAMEQLVEQIQEQYGIPSYFEADRQPKPLDDDVAVLLFQTVRELLVNVTKHAQAHNVRTCIKRLDSDIRIIIEDDGIGFDSTGMGSSKKRPKGFGLFSIRERLHYIGGHFEVESEPGRGTKVTIVAPLKHE